MINALANAAGPTPINRERASKVKSSVNQRRSAVKESRSWFPFVLFACLAILVAKSEFVYIRG
jgi:hypothetical protein